MGSRANRNNKAEISNSSGVCLIAWTGPEVFCNVLPFKVGAIEAIGLFLCNVTKVLDEGYSKLISKSFKMKM